ncbi:MAG: dihydropteroate synthase [Gemmatimonadetes bacterium]|nr:dihydropteroate synthase [Gemmatimonadota bacterium]
MTVGSGAPAGASGIGPWLGADPRFAGYWQAGGRHIPLGRPVILGVLNLTPDSFSDGGEFTTVDAALRRAETLLTQGADILDVGGESTRPGAASVPEGEERRRVVPFLEAVARRFDVPLSVDTRKASVARAALDAGAIIVNDVSGLAADPAMAPLLAERGAGVVLMHMRGEPATMQQLATYRDVAGEVAAELGTAVDRAIAVGIPRDAIVVDPGIGFAKTAEQNFVLLRELGRIVTLGYPVLVGPSRKSFIGRILGLPPRERVEGTIAACVLAHAAGARLFRVHDVGAARRALTVSHWVLTHP